MIEQIFEAIGGLVMLGLALTVVILAWVIPGLTIAAAIGLFSKARTDTEGREG